MSDTLAVLAASLKQSVEAWQTIAGQWEALGRTEKANAARAEAERLQAELQRVLKRLLS